MTQKWTARKITWIAPLILSASLTASAADEGTVKSDIGSVGATENVKADNTKRNKRDNKEGMLTAQDQVKGSSADVELTRQIRQEIVKDDSLSTNAKNVKIITIGGVVTLRGPVASEAEKNKISSAAQNMSGVKRVDNKLEIKTE